MMTCDLCGQALNSERAWNATGIFAAHEGCERAMKIANIETGMHRHYCHKDDCERYGP